MIALRLQACLPYLQLRSTSRMSSFTEYIPVTTG